MTAGDRQTPVKAKALLVDASSMRVVWMNESAAQRAASPEATEVSDVLPVPESLDMPEALRSVARTGEARHLSYDLISSGLGAVAIVTSIYSLPDAMLLLVSETTFLASHRKPADELGERRSRRRT